MQRVAAGILLGGMAFLFMSSWAKADAKADYEAIFGPEARRVDATRETEDDAAFAEKLYESSQRLSDSPELKALVLDKAFQYGIRNLAGLDTAERAIRRNRSVDSDEKIVRDLKVEEARFRLSSGKEKIEAGERYVQALLDWAQAYASQKPERADELLATALPVATSLRSTQVKEILDRRRALAQARSAQLAREARFKMLQTRLAKDPADESARRGLILYHLLERNDPAQANKLLTKDLDETFRTYLPMTVQPPTTFTENLCLELGGWYESLAQSATTEGKATALSRALDCYRRYASLHRRQDAEGLKVQLSVEKLEKALGKGYVRPPTLRWSSHYRPPPTQASPVPDSSKTLTLDLGKGVTMKLVLIPAGKFLMGSPKEDKDQDGDGRETPQHEVTISSPFYMGVTEVTQAQWKAVMETEPWKGREYTREGNENPAGYITFPGAIAFCSALSRRTGRVFRLPTEAEWEYACRAGTATRYSFGNDSEVGAYAWYDRNARNVGERYGHRVATKAPNPWGLYDMHGNMWEWCGDWYDPKYYATGANVTDPTGPLTGETRVLRSGSFYNGERSCRSACRHRVAPDVPVNDHGFRIVAPLPDERTLTLDLGKDVTMKLVLIPPGKFLMGSPDSDKDACDDEKPQHEVTISKPFYMGVYEVTQAQYEAMMGKNPSEFKGRDRPVENLSWQDAVKFCKEMSAKTGKTVRLPTEAEWEYACRAGTTTRFSFGDDGADLHQFGNYCDRSCTFPWRGKKDAAHSDGHDRTAPVGSFKPNPFGLYDMHGNVWEWCSDWYAESYAKLPAGEAGGKTVDPTGPTSGTKRVLRSGCWHMVGPSMCRSAVRRTNPGYNCYQEGFRVVVDASDGSVTGSVRSTGHSGGVSAVAVSRDGRLLATGGGDGRVMIWDAASWKRLHMLEGHRKGIEGVAFSPDGGHLASAGRDEDVIVWDPATGKRVAQLQARSSGVAYSHDGKLLASGDYGGKVRLWGAPDYKPLEVIDAQSGDIQWVDFSRDGRWLAGGGGARCAIIDMSSRKLARVLPASNWFVMRVEFSPDSRYLAAATSESSAGGPRLGKLIFYDARYWTELRFLRTGLEETPYATFLPDGKRVVLWSHLGRFRVLSSPDLRTVATMSGKSGSPAVAVFPDGRRAITGAEDGTVTVWRLPE
ncbi:MAG: Serine/threonine-protein kinase pkn1 [Planctomycetes bacterium ADurb.Bin126]|nr:MAG: Serine/threonine-protein kinase pkn1 [Planctomycetes bacterium ADurb.Bin126]HOD80927.1 SUMF1/EgtB/PvdO family nonheme iron enzyme [Phycisphaerae bacterium]HQL72025.1 SUMF1/EgtB/PvdO family nonheme iron enzyme [Phycisphaerae bacterium]